MDERKNAAGFLEKYRNDSTNDEKVLSLSCAYSSLSLPKPDKLEKAVAWIRGDGDGGESAPCVKLSQVEMEKLAKTLAEALG